MIDSFEQLFEQARPAFAQERTFQRAYRLALSSLVGLGRRTVSGMLCTSGQQFVDWSAAYRLFEHQRFDRQALFAPVLRAVEAHLGREEPLVVMVDDTLIRKRGRRVHGSQWRRDPLGPRFSTNLVWGQRFVQVSAAWPDGSGVGRARGVPIDLVHAPLPVKPGKRGGAAQWQAYRDEQRTMKLSVVGAQRVAEVRRRLDGTGDGLNRWLIASLDGGLTNQTVFRSIPDHTILIGRIRKDARLFAPPVPQDKPRRGRPRWYGDPLPTPEQIRCDETMPWIRVQAFAAGKIHRFQVKTLPAVRWLGTGSRDVRLVVIRPLGYRLRKGARVLYRDPAYLLCTDPQLPLDRLLQAYLWRWEVEVNFRDEKTLLGVGEAHVRTPTAVEAVPALIVAAYAFLLLADRYPDRPATPLPPPKWRKMAPSDRTSTARLIGLLRSQLWGKAMGVNLTHFQRAAHCNTNPCLFHNSLPSAVCYSFR